MSATLVTEDSFRQLVGVALNACNADNVFVTFEDAAGGTTRFANNQVVQNVDTHRRTLAVAATFKGRQCGRASTTDLSDAAVRATAAQAVAAARQLPDDPEYLPPLPPQRYPVLPTLRRETAEAGPDRRLAEARAAIERCRAEGLSAAGIVETSVRAVGLAANTGLFAYEPRTRAEFSITAASGGSTGWATGADRSIDDLGVGNCTRRAIEKARRAADPRELPPGRYTVILEPAAVAGLLGPLLAMLDARAYHKGTSPLRGKLGQPLLDPRLTLRNRPDHPSLLGHGFDAQGLPSDFATWIDRGVLKRLHYDRFTAQQHGVQPSSAFDAPHLSGVGPLGESVDDLIRTTERGILVTNFWYIRAVNDNDLTLTGMTRDGTFLVEDGQVTTGLINFRWHDSPLRAFNQIDTFTTPLDALTAWETKVLVPAMRVRDFNFTSVTRF